MPERNNISRAMREMDRVGQGVFQISSCTRVGYLEALLFGSETGLDHYDLTIIKDAIEAIMSGAARGTQCLFCETAFSPRELPERIVVLRPQTDALDAATDIDGLTVICNGICAKCESDGVDADRIEKRYCEQFSNFRRLRVSKGSGHA